MNQYTIYHNPRCSKSRQALELLQQHHIQPNIIEYLKTPLSLEQLKSLRAYFDLSEFVRVNEPIFKTLHLSLQDETTVLNAMIEHPILMQRPIIAYNQNVFIARPPEKLLAFLI